MKPYPAYKPSGEQWMGEVPAHWEVLPLKQSFKIIGGSTPKSDNESFWDGDILWATPSDLSKRESVYISDTQRKITADGLASCGATLVPAASIVLSTRAPIGSLAIAEMALCTNQGCKSLVPSERANTEYFAHLLSISSAELNIRGKGTTFLELSGDALGSFKTPVPPITEQTQIAAYLDRETARVDTLIAEKGRLIETLREYRQATISEVVTQGLDPTAPKKPSGVPWLGEIPAHWGLKRFKFHVEQVGEKTSEPLAGVAYIGLEHIESGTGKFISSMDGTQTESESTVSHFCVGDVLFGKLRPYLAKAVIAYGDGVCTTELLVLRPNSMDSGYLLSCLLLDGFIKTVDASTFGAKMPRADWTFISNLLLPEPPAVEQQAIAAYLDTETARIDALLAHVQDEIKLLQELRAATITDAVTGKIQVS